jgi:hypothetical protein
MIKNTQAQITVIQEEEILAKLQGLSDHIATFLCRKGMLEKIRQDLHNPTVLGGVKFWFQIDPRSHSTILCYDKHPTGWNIDKILKDINDLEHIFYEQESGIIHWKW